MVFLIGIGLLCCGLYMLKAIAQAPNAGDNPRHGLRGVAKVLVVFGGLIIIGFLVEAGILK